MFTGSWRKKHDHNAFFLASICIISNNEDVDGLLTGLISDFFSFSFSLSFPCFLNSLREQRKSRKAPERSLIRSRPC